MREDWDGLKGLEMSGREEREGWRSDEARADRRECLEDLLGQGTRDAGLPALVKSLEALAFKSSLTEEEYEERIADALDNSLRRARRDRDGTKEEIKLQCIDGALTFLHKLEGKIEPPVQLLKSVKLLRKQLDDWEPQELCEKVLKLMEEAGVGGDLRSAAEETMSPGLRRLGFCCPIPHRFSHLRPVRCDGNAAHVILPGQQCFIWDDADGPTALSRDSPLHFCRPCVGRREFRRLGVGRETLRETTVSQDPSEEESLSCGECGAPSHPICLGFDSKSSRAPFRCSSCLQMRNGILDYFKDSQFASLTETEVTRGVEVFLRGFLEESREEGETLSPFLVRAVTALDSSFPASRQLRFARPDLPQDVPYHKEFFLVAQVQESKLVPSFGLWVYTSSLETQKDMLYLSYLEGLRFAEPKRLKRSLTKATLAAFLQAYAGLGYRWATWWSCAPSSPSMDYVFLGRAQGLPKNFYNGLQDRDAQGREQRLLALQQKTQAALDTFYRELLSESKDRFVVRFFHSSFKEWREAGYGTSLRELPIFAEDIIGNLLSENCKGLKKMDEAKEQSLMKKVEKEMEDQKVSYFFARLNEGVKETPARREQIWSLLASSRLGLLDRMEGKGWEFGSRRRAVFLLQCLCGELAGEREGRPAEGLLRVFEHAASCAEGGCRRAGCGTARDLVAHFPTCRRPKAECQRCRNYASLLYFHSPSCGDDACPLPGCLPLKDREARRQRTRRSL